MNKKFFYFLAFVSFLSQEDYGTESFDFRSSEEERSAVRNLREIQNDIRESLDDIQKCLKSLPIVRYDEKRAHLRNFAICEALAEIFDINHYLLGQILDIDTVFREGKKQINELKNFDEIKQLSELISQLLIALDEEEKYHNERKNVLISHQETVLLQTINGDIIPSFQEVQIEEGTPSQDISFCEDIKKMSVIHEKVENLRYYIEHITLPKETSLSKNMIRFWKIINRK